MQPVCDGLMAKNQMFFRFDFLDPERQEPWFFSFIEEGKHLQITYQALARTQPPNAYRFDFLNIK
jgi:hypothetical protein